MREPLTGHRALLAAVALADRDGLESLSMRKLAAELGVEAMSLYYHVKNKGEILDGMVDIVFGELALPPIAGPWRGTMEEQAAQMRAALARHPWAIALLDSRTSPGPARLAHLNATIGCLVGDGFTMREAAHAMALIDSYVRGFALQEHALPSKDGDMTEVTEEILQQQAMMSGAFPFLGAMAAEVVLQPGYAFADEFDWGLQMIMDAVASAVRQR